MEVNGAISLTIGWNHLVVQPATVPFYCDLAHVIGITNKE